MVIGGFFSTPKVAGVFDWLTSRIGTRISGRLPVTWIRVEFGNGTRISSARRADTARSLGTALMVEPRAETSKNRPAI